jgi:hypothetical protein
MAPVVVPDKIKTLTKEEIVELIELAHDIQTKIELVKSAVYSDDILSTDQNITIRLDTLDKLVDNLAHATRHLDEMYLLVHGVSASDYMGVDIEEEENAAPQF